MIFIILLLVIIALIALNIYISTKLNRFVDLQCGLFPLTRVIRTRERLLSSEYGPLNNPNIVYYPEYYTPESGCYRGFVLKTAPKKEVYFNTEQEANKFINEFKEWNFKYYDENKMRGMIVFFVIMALILCVGIYKISEYEDNWKQFAKEHNCKYIGFKKGHKLNTYFYSCDDGQIHDGTAPEK